MLNLYNEWPRLKILSIDGDMPPETCRVPYECNAFTAMPNFKELRSPYTSGVNPEPKGLSQMYWPSTGCDAINNLP